jgi:hypothetical protein
MDSIALAKKLVIKHGNRVLMLNPDAVFVDTLTIIEGLSIETGLTSGKYDVVILFVNNVAELEKFVPKAISTATDGTLLWIAYPKRSSGIKTDISRDRGWESVTAEGFIPVSLVSFDEKWSLLRFRRTSEVMKITRGIATAERSNLVLPDEFLNALNANHLLIAFEKMAFTHRKEYIRWIEEAKKEETRLNRITKAINMIAMNKKLN